MEVCSLTADIFDYHAAGFLTHDDGCGSLAILCARSNLIDHLTQAPRADPRPDLFHGALSIFSLIAGSSAERIRLFVPQCFNRIKR
jgi:hypothetical protein